MRMKILEKLTQMLKRNKDEDVVEETVTTSEAVDNITKVESIRQSVEEEDIEETLDPWKAFIDVCNDADIDYSEAILKTAWKYIEDSGFGGYMDPIEQAKEITNVIKELEESFEKMNEPVTLKKLRSYKEAIKELAEFKTAVKELKTGKMTTMEMIELVKTILDKMK